MSKEIFLILNLTIAFYNVGTIWAVELDIFRSWQYLDPKTFHRVHTAHWKYLPYWIFTPVWLALIGLIILFWYHPVSIPSWEIVFPFAFQFLSNFLSAVFWGRWQARLAKDELGGESPYLKKILKTHWIRTLLINAYAISLLCIVIQSLQ